MLFFGSVNVLYTVWQEHFVSEDLQKNLSREMFHFRNLEGNGGNPEKEKRVQILKLA